MGNPWYSDQKATTPEDRHPIMVWIESTRRFLVSAPSQSEEGGVRSALATGDAWSLISLAYDVFQLLHRGHLPPEIVDRLRKRSEFQGARYEIAVAAICVRARLDVRFVRPEPSHKNHDMVVSDPVSGSRIAIEAKSRRRPGILGMPGVIDEAKALRGDVERLISEAMRQNPGGGPFMVFIDINVPPVSGIPMQERTWFRDLWEMIGSLKTPSPAEPDEWNALIVTNFSYHWDGNRVMTGAQYAPIISKFPRYPVSEELTGRIVGSVKGYGTVPHEV